MNTDNYNDVVTKLQHYMLDEDNIKSALELVITPDKKEHKMFIKPNNNSKNSLFRPYERDTLFWCFYVMKNGETDYEMLNSRNLITEKKLKIDYIEQIRKDKQQVKAYKFATLSHLENMLANEHRIDVGTFLSLCVFENLNVLFIKNKTYFELLMNDGEPIHIVHSLDNYKYGYETKSNNQDIVLSLFKIDNFDKPIKAISSYKVQELVDICEKLSIDTIHKETGKIKSKKDLYELIVQYF